LWLSSLVTFRGLLQIDEKRSVDKVIEERADPLEMLLRKAVNESRAVIVTLKTGKVYVGHVLCNFNPAYDVQSLKILTIMSGYRKAEDKNVIFNIDYGSVLRAAHAKDPKVTRRDVEDLGTVIPLAEITSVGLFSLPMYKQFFATLNTRPTHDHP
jgi:hypothetical protein